ncbi:MAG: anhydro-N-acetylmuramic acid kinase [Planctomycetes bacterium]|nr:anhydro-N-acetylmuramic acid kinase [Planctomycetota bacterium]
MAWSRAMRWMDEFEAKLAREGVLVAGVLSGTSADGIDVALARFTGRRAATTTPAGLEAGWELDAPTLAHFETLPFEPALHARVRAVLDGAPCGLAETARLHCDLGRAFGAAARVVAERAGAAIDLVGSHGQTVWHHDGVEPTGPATLQLGDGDFVAEAAAAPVVSDFRQRDVAAGGEGAPISALADDLIFARAPRPCAVLNLGGMGNLTLLFARREDTLAFDTGPANSLLDGLARELFAARFDAGGERAARGRADPARITRHLAHPFFDRPPPKSTGRDTFGAPWVRAFVAEAVGERRGLSEVERCDLLATGVELVARSVALALERWSPERLRALHVAGGGVHNRALLAALERATGLEVASSRALGVDPDAREGLVFATLALRCVLGVSVTAPGATGAALGRPLGKWSPPAWAPANGTPARAPQAPRAE